MVFYCVSAANLMFIVLCPLLLYSCKMHDRCQAFWGSNANLFSVMLKTSQSIPRDTSLE